MTQHDIEAQQAFHDHEMAIETAGDRAYGRFLDEVSRITGIANLDGDNSAQAKAEGRADGYSLDDCLDWFEAGKTPAEAAAIIQPPVAAVWSLTEPQAEDVLAALSFWINQHKTWIEVHGDRQAKSVLQGAQAQLRRIENLSLDLKNLPLPTGETT